MEKATTQTINTPIVDQPVKPVAEWQGYTMDELRFQRALALIKLETEKDRLNQKIRVKIEETKSATSAVGFSTNIFKRVSSKMKFIDYALIGFNIAKFVLKLRKKK
jgi:hypothetical protein